MMTHRRWWAGLVALLATELMSGLAPLTIGAGSAWLPEVSDSQDLSTPIAAAGQLVGVDGNATQGRLVLIAWPRQQVLERVKVGDTVKLIPLAKSTTEADGTFALRVDPKANIEEALAADGTINVDLVAAGPEGAQVTSFSIKAVGAGSAISWGRTAGSADRLRLAISLTARSVDTDSVPVPAPATDKPACGAAVATYDQRTHIVGEVYTGPNSKGTFTYTNGSSSSVGVGFSYSGTYGSFSQSGTTSTSSTHTEGFPQQPQRALTIMETKFGWKKYFVCEYLPDIEYYEVRPYQFQGGQLKYTAAAAPTATYCSPTLKGGYTMKDTAQAVTFSNAVKIASVIGIDLSSTTGFNSHTSIRFDWVNAGRICGSNTFPPNANRVVAK